MSEATETTTPTETPVPTPADVAEATKGKGTETPEQTIEGLRAALAKANTEARDNRIKAKELDDVKASQMSELEKAQAEVVSYRESAAKATAEALRFRIAAEHSLTSDDAELLTGDEDAMRRLAGRLAAAAEAAASPRAPRPNPAQQVGDSPAEDKDALARSFFGIS